MNDHTDGAGGQTTPATSSSGISAGDWQVGKNEVVMTLEQAKTAKLAKGFALEPVRPGSLESNAPLREKRDRKKVDVFGYEDQQKARESAAPKSKDHKPKPKPKPKIAAPQGNGSGAAPKPAPVSASPQIAPSVYVGPSPYEDRKRVLQDRLKRIEAQIKRLDRMGMTKVEVPSATPYSSVPQQVASSVPPHMQAIVHEAPAAVGTKRRMSEMGGGGVGGGAGNVSVKKPKSGSGTSTPNRGTKLGHKAEVIMSSLMENPASKAYFNRPVDPIADGVPNYPEIITEPMDLGTIKKRMTSSRYESHEQWADDIQKVWSNAMSFNAPGNDVHESAKNLKVQFEAYYKQYFKAGSGAMTPKAVSQMVPKAASPAPIRQDSPAAGGVALLQRQMDQMQRELEAVQNKAGGGSKGVSGGTATKKKAGGGGTGRCNMTFEEKRKLSLNINKLSHEKLAKVVEIIKKKKKVDDGEEIEIDIDSLGEATLRELDTYVQACLNPSKQAGSKTGNLHQAAQAVVQSAHTALKRPPSDSESSSSSSSESSSSESDSDESDAKPGAGAARRKPTEREAEDDDEFSGGESSDSDGVRRKKKSGGSKKPPAAKAGGVGKGLGGGGKGTLGAPSKPATATGSAAGGGGEGSSAGGNSISAAASGSAGAGALGKAANASGPDPAAGCASVATDAQGAAQSAIEKTAPEDAVQEPTQKPQILPTEPVKKAVEIKNTADWGASLMDDDDEDEDVADKQTTAGPGAHALWSQFQTKDQLQKQREEEKRKEEEREKQRQEEDAKRAKELAAEEERIRQQKQKEEEENEKRAAEEKRKQQEAQREAEKAERERQTQTVNMDAQLMLAKEVSVAGASILTAKDAAGGGSGIASMLAGLRGGESSDSSDSDDD